MPSVQTGNQKANNEEAMKKQEPVNCSDSELCIYLAALEAGYLPMFYSGINQSAQSRSMSIASKSYQRGRKTVSFHGFQYLTMCKHSMDDHGAESLTSLQEDSHAKTSASPGKVPESTESAAGYGVKWRASLAKYDPALRSWKTAQRSLIEDSDECSVIWPRSGMTVDGECWELPMLVRRTKETDCGLWRTPSASIVDPKSTVLKQTGRKPSDPQVGLADQVGGRLSPMWVEWLMGWPLGWTDLKPLEMDRCHYALQQHGAC